MTIRHCEGRGTQPVASEERVPKTSDTIQHPLLSLDSLLDRWRALRDRPAFAGWRKGEGGAARRQPQALAARRPGAGGPKVGSALVRSV